MRGFNRGNWLGKLQTKFSGDALAWWLWVLYGLTIILQTLNDTPSPGNVCAIYFRAGADLLAGRSLYSEPYFMYLPSAACFFTPFACAPFTLMAALWKFVNLAVFSAGVFSLASTKRTDGNRAAFLQISAVSCMLSIGASKHGQMTLAMAGLLMLAAVNLERSHLWKASLFMALSLALKPIALPFLLLAAVAYRASLLRTILFSLVMFLLPFLFQDAVYVLAQYADVPRMLRTTAQIKGSSVIPSLVGFLQAIGVGLGNVEQLLVRMLCAIVALLVYVAGKSRLRESADRSLYLYGICAGYILLLSPATEKNTYAMLAPVTGLLWCLAGSQRHRLVQVALGVVVLSSLLSHTISEMLSRTPLAQMAKPFGAVVVMTILVQRAFSQPRSGRQSHGVATSDPAPGSKAGASRV